MIHFHIFHRNEEFFFHSAFSTSNINNEGKEKQFGEEEIKLFPVSLLLLKLYFFFLSFAFMRKVLPLIFLSL
jgi:hypothetical protein